MHHSAYVNAEKFYKKYCEENIENKKILDVGSYDTNGCMRPIFQKGNYVGVDMEFGPNVDIVANANDLPFKENTFDIVISSSCFEHDDMFWETFREMCRVTKPGGYIYVQAPSNGPYHGWPGDNWRFYIDSWLALERWGKKIGYNIELVDRYIDYDTPPSDNEGNRIWDDSIGIFIKREDIKFKVDLKSVERGHLNTTYRGIPMYKCPYDYVTYQMIINEIKPNLIIEIGTFHGGSALYMADILDKIGKGEIHTIDVVDVVYDENVINNNRIKRFFGGYENYDLNNVLGYDKILIIDDGSHTSGDVRNAFLKFNHLVSENSYYIIEDGILSELGYDLDYDGGPLKVINEIMKENNQFIIDRKWCDFFGGNSTFNPQGYLKKIR